MPPNILKVDSVQLSFDDRKILQDVVLQCRQGEIVGLLGRNGSGKSSLLKIIFGSLMPSYKYVSINDEYIYSGYADGRIAYLPQHNYLPHGIKISALARIVIDKLFWDEFANQEVYQKHYHKTVGQLSGGELRMLETLLIIYNKADFILLDEPFTHISPVQTEYFKPVIKACAERKGIIITDHQYYNVLDVSDKLIILENGCTRPVNHIDELITYRYLSGIN
ncbi:MAG TPA: ATP-binding cassette domain-containing protein [Mucilaginibacter sp.]|jgi:ABC-type multidrug transport system ATPase subunit